MTKHLLTRVDQALNEVTGADIGPQKPRLSMAVLKQQGKQIDKEVADWNASTIGYVITT